jgi:glycosyltransferase involved in cell wall biosynthesis
MKKIRVAFFADILVEDFDGATRTMFQLIRRIPAQRFEFLFIAGMGPAAIAGYECFKVPAMNLFINAGYKIALPQLHKKALHTRLEDFNPDIVHIATPSLLGEFALQYATASRLPVISIYHTHFISYIGYYLKHLPFLIAPVKGRLTEVQTNFYNRCTKVYVPAESIAAELKSTGIHAEAITIWKRGIEPGLFSPLKRDSIFIQRLTGNALPNVLFASRLVWEKNLETLIRIYEVMQLMQLPCNLVIAGDGGAAKACRKRMPRAIFTGKLNHQQLSTLYASSDIFLFTSVSETIGNVVLEAMASGLPCVIADGGGSADFIRQGINGFKCTYNREYAYISKIKMLLNNQSLRQAIAAAALQYSRSFDWDELAAAYFDDVTKLSLQYAKPAPAFKTIAVPTLEPSL